MRKKNKKKYYKPRGKAELSLQFYRDSQGTPNFLVTSNPLEDGKDFCTGIDVMIFAENFVKCGYASPLEIDFLCKFFARVAVAKKDIELKKQMKRVEIYVNGMVAVFDGNGDQMPHLQGEWNAKKNEIFKADTGPVEYRFGIWKGQMVLLDISIVRRLTIDAPAF